MPSGFQQDQNQLTPSYYRVVITMQGGTEDWYSLDSNDGDNTNGRISSYAWDNFEGDNRPNTLAKARALARGNLRFQAIVEALSNLADCQILDVENNNGASDMYDNYNIVFTVKFDRDEGVLPAYCAIRKAEGASSDGTITYDNVVYPNYYLYPENDATINSGNNVTQVIRDVIWHAIQQSHTRSVRVFHPVEGSDPLEGEGAQEVITASQPFNNWSNGFSDIAVSEINGTTTTVGYD